MIPGLEFKTEREIEDHADSLTEKEWKQVSFHLCELSNEFAERFQEKIKWSNVATNGKNSLSLILKHKKKINSDRLYLFSRICFQAHFGPRIKTYIVELEEIEKEPELIVRAYRVFTIIDKDKQEKLKKTTDDTRARF